MPITVEATYEDGVLKPVKPLPLKEHDRVQMTVHKAAEVQAALDAVERSYGLLGWTGDHETLERLLAEAEEAGELQ